MMIVWLPRAIANRGALIDHIAEESPLAAIGQDGHIEEQTDQFADFPEIGRTGRKAGTRELVISDTSFVVVYRIRPRAKRVEILRVLHTSQLYP